MDGTGGWQGKGVEVKDGTRAWQGKGVEVMDGTRAWQGKGVGVKRQCMRKYTTAAPADVQGHGLDRRTRRRYQGTTLLPPTRGC